jgi:homoserine kinase
MKTVKIFAPASVGNSACGFDVIGFAIDAPGDELIVSLTDKHQAIKIIDIQGDNGKLSWDSAKNTASVAIQAYLQHLGIQQGVEIRLHKKMPLGSGLGSSAASAVAGAVAINELMDKPLKRKDLLPFAMEGERIACGAAHADNVAPSLIGGFVLVRSYNPLDVVPIKTPQNLIAIVVHPHIEVSTKTAREILPKEISLPTAITQWGNVGGLVAGLCMADMGLIGRSLQDVVAEPVRAKLIPHFEAIKQAMLAAGALGSSISGSGPSVFALASNTDTSEKVKVAVVTLLNSVGMPHDIYVSPINLQGAKVIG